MRERLRREYFRRVKMVLRTELYGRNKVLAINGLALPLLTYSFGVIHWGTTDLQQLDRRTRKLLTMHGVHHPSADVDRLYAPCNEGGRGLQQIEAMYKSCSVGLECYLRDSFDPYMQLVYECDSGRSRYSIKSMASRFTAQLLVVAAQDQALRTRYSSTTSCIEMSVPLAACAVQAWKQSTTLCQAVVQWHRRTTLIDKPRSLPSSTGTFVGIFRFQWSAGGIGINLIGLWRRMTL